MRDAECWTNHHLIISKLKGLHFKLKRRLQGQKVTMQLNVTKLKNSETVNDLQSAVNRKLSNLPTPSNDIEEAWASLGTQFTLLPSKSSGDHQEAPRLVRGK